MLKILKTLGRASQNNCSNIKTVMHRRLRVPVVGRPVDQIMGRIRDVHGTSVKHVF